MKRMRLLIMCMVLFGPMALGGYDDYYLLDGQHRTNSYIGYRQRLLVDGGTAHYIRVNDQGIAKVLSTGTLPGATYGIEALDIESGGSVYFFGGRADFVTIRGESTLIYKGGNIRVLRNYENPNTNIVIECLPGWSWRYGQDPGDEHIILGIRGQWADGTSFDTYLGDYRSSGDGWPGITVNEIPEPITLALLGLGGLFIRRKQ